MVVSLNYNNYQYLEQLLPPPSLTIYALEISSLFTCYTTALPLVTVWCSLTFTPLICIALD